MASTARIDELQKKFDENPRRYFAPLANEYRKSGQVDRAIALCREHLPKQPGHMSGHIVYGQALYEIGEREEAQRVFQSALDLDPENVIALRHMGDIEREGGHADEARRWYTRVLDADPHDAQVTSLISSLDSSRAAADAGREGERIDGELEQRPAATGPADTFGDDAFAYPPIDASLDGEPVFTDESLLTTTAGDMLVGRSDVGRMDLTDLDLPDERSVEDGDRVEAPAAGEAQNSGWSGNWREPASDASAGLGESGSGLDALAPADAELSGAPAAAEDDGEAVLPIEAFGYDAEHEAAPIAAAGLPSIDAFVYDAGAEAGGEAVPSEVAPEVPSIDAFGYDEPSIDEFLLVVADDEELAAPAFAETVDAPSAASDFLVVAEVEVIEVIELPEEVPEIERPRGAEPSGAPAELLAPEAVGGARDAAGGAGSPFVTATMAELYLRQGFRDEALGVYRQLLASDPYNVAISAKVRELTGEFPSVAQDAEAASESAAERAQVDAAPEAAVGVEPAISARVFFASLVTRRPSRAEGHRPEAATDAMPDAAVADQTAGPADAVTAAAVESRSAPEAAVGDAHASSGLGFGAEDLDSFVEPPEGADRGGELLMIEAYSYDQTGGPGTGDATGATTLDATTLDATTLDATTLDALFGHAPVTAEDSAAAAALAAAFGTVAADAPGDAEGDQREAAGRPARPATTELSLDEIFRGGAPDAAATRRTTPTAFSFDQFFTDEAPAATPSGGGPEAAQSSRLGEESAGDLEQFNAWLEGLKRK